MGCNDAGGIFFSPIGRAGADASPERQSRARGASGMTIDRKIHPNFLAVIYCETPWH